MTFMVSLQGSYFTQMIMLPSAGQGYVAMKSKLHTLFLGLILPKRVVVAPVAAYKNFVPDRTILI